MSFELTMLTGLIAALALVTLVRPAMLFEYPFVVAMLMWFFVIPQAWRIEADGQYADYQPTLTWGYMVLCILMTVVGFFFGKARSTIGDIGSFEQLRVEYDMNKLLNGAIVLTAIGSIALVLMNRIASTMERGAAWSGPIAFYALLATLLIYGMSLAWIIYLYTGSKKALIISVFGLIPQIPAVLILARREVAFVLVAVFLLGLLFVKNKSISRLILIPMIVLGGIFVNQAGNIRAQISVNDSSLISALSSKEVLEKSEEDSNSETASGVSDIAVANWTNDYLLFAPYYNTLVHLYVPAFIVGRNVKDGLAINYGGTSGDYKVLEFGGSTRTGFADSFQCFHYFGCVVFGVISYFMGSLWVKARRGHIKSQLYYMMLIPAGLKVVTESTCIFVGVLPLVFLSLSGVFKYAKRRQATGAQSAGNTSVALQADTHAR